MNRLIMITTLALVIPIALFAQINWTGHLIDDNFDGASSVYAIDLDSDGDMDVLGTATDADDIVWWENDGGRPPTFTKHIIDSLFDGASSVYAIDLNGDSLVDVLGTASVADEIVWWENDGAGNFGIKHIIDSTFDYASSVYAIDLSGDSLVDVLATASFSDEIVWWRNDGVGNFGTKLIIDSTFDNINSCYSIDLDGDDDADVLGTRGNDDEIAWWRNDGAGNFGIKQTIDSTFDGAGIAYGVDLDGDGDADVLGAGYNAHEIAWWENDGAGNFGTKQSIAGDRSSRIYGIDLDSDGDVDVIGQGRSSPYKISWWENDSVGNFGTEHTIDTTFVSVRSLYAVDLDGDGDVDVLGTAAGDTDDVIWWESDFADMHDVGTISIDIPSIVPPDTIVYPKATVKNWGTKNEDVVVTCKINPGDYSSSKGINDLLPDSSEQVTFNKDFTFASGPYTVTVYTECPFTVDENPANDTLEKVIQTTGIAKGGSVTPALFSFKLQSNPISGKAIFNLALPKDASVTLEIYDVSGRLVDIPLKDRKSSGNHTITWTASNNGIYFYTFESSGHKENGKLVILR